MARSRCNNIQGSISQIRRSRSSELDSRSPPNFFGHILKMHILRSVERPLAADGPAVL